MKTELRRAERAMKTPEEMERLLARMSVGCLSVATQDGPYAVAMNYLFVDGCIYLHSANAGRKIEAIKRDTKICFMVHEDGPLIIRDQACGISQIYKSVICFGKASFVEDAGEKKQVLEKMVGKYAPNHGQAITMNTGNIERTTVIKIAIEAMSGKTNEATPPYTALQDRDTKTE